MTSWLKRFLAARNTTLNGALGDVISEREAIQGATKHSYAKCRLKRSVAGDHCFVSVEFKPDYHAGHEGGPKHWIDFELDSAERLRDALDACIAELKTPFTPPHDRSS